jgi:hypothetical protein
MPDIHGLDRQAAQDDADVRAVLHPIVGIFDRIVGVLVMMQMQRAKAGIGRQQHKAADMPDQMIDPLPARMAARDIVVRRLMQGGEDAIDQDGFDRHRHPIR